MTWPSLNSAEPRASDIAIWCSMKRGADVCVELPGLTLIHQNQPGLLIHNHVHESHEVLIPLEGDFTVTISDKSWRVNPSEMFWLPNGTHHSFSSDDNRCGERLVLLFDEKVWNKWKGVKRAATLFPCHQLIKELSFYIITKGSKVSGTALVDALISIVSEVVGQHSEVLGRAEDVELDPATRKALDALAARFTDDLTIEELAGVAGTSPRHLSRLFSRQVGMSPKQLLIKYRIQEACRLLRDSRLSVTDVAFESGFGSLSRFIEAFRSQVGMLPSDYRGQASTRTKAE